ncbi:MAG: VWA domain-containing protein [Desulfatitalea sp.]|nr:VWA domain-containing protein [Desulfatitalea sp.]NNK01565.1 VWA domain-containing protein [Desulfatitalea sp.]
MRTYKQSLIVILALMAATGAAMAFIRADGATAPLKPPVRQADDGRVALTVQTVQEKVLRHSDGKVAVAVTLTAEPPPRTQERPVQPVDLVVVLDRSGSMGGAKIDEARQAVEHLIKRLTPRDRLALITYSDGVRRIAPLTPVDGQGGHDLSAAVRRIQSGGGTNLGGGLQAGIAIFTQSPEPERQRKVILISDGLANQGITDPRRLGQMAAMATDHHFAVSTVGVGLDFNELLMTTIADHGLGSYHFLEDPRTFAQAFEKEFQHARQVAAADLELRVPVEKGVRLVDAGGYPIVIQNGHAVIRPGQLVAGQERKLFLTFQVPTDETGDHLLGRVQLHYRHQGRSHILNSPQPLQIACVADEKEVFASVDDAAWSRQVLQDEYNRLKEQVASAVREGDERRAEARIQEYETKKRNMNAVIGSAAIEEHLDRDVKSLKQSVTDTFTGPPAAAAAKQKQKAKMLQYESYQGRRDKK